MKEQIDKLNATEHSQIYKIVLKDNTKTTQTPSGVLVSSEHLSEECLKEIEQYIIYCIDQRSRMDEDLKTRKTYERMVE
jgi:hypothetical protein